MKSLRVLALLAVAACLASVVVAQSTTEVIVHKTGTVIAKYDGKVVVQVDGGGVREFTPKPGATILVDGVPTNYDGLKVGTVLAADIVQKETTTPVKVTTIKNGKVVKVTGTTVVVQHADGTYKSHTVPAGMKILVEGKEVAVQDLRAGMNLTATIVSVKTETTSSTELKGVAGVAPAAPAPAPAPAPAKLPKTGGPLPLVALAGAASLLAGLGLRLRRTR